MQKTAQAKQSPGTAAETPPSILSVNNIEVIYDHVILVLKGVSLEVPLGGLGALDYGAIVAYVVHDFR